MKRFTALLLTLFFILAVAAGCGSSSNPQAGSDSAASTPPDTAASAPEETQKFTVDKIALTYVKSPLNVPSIVEKQKGMFAEAFKAYGLPVEYSNLTTGPEQTQALASGDIQFLYAVGATSVILSASNGADIKIISTYSRSPEAFMLFAKDDRIKSAADLKGKKVAGPKGTILHELLVAYLATVGLTEADIEFASMGIPDSQAALLGGQVDAALLAGPTAYNMSKNGYAVVTTGKGLVDATIVVATSNAFYEKNPLLVETFLKTQKEVLEYINSSRDEVMEITAKETELSKEAVEEMFKMYDFNMEITPTDIQSMKKTVAFMKANDMIQNDVDIESLIIKK